MPAGPAAFDSATRRDGPHAALLTQLHDTAERAAAASGGWRDVRLAIADRGTTLRLAGDVFPATALPAFAHLGSSALAPELTVRMWDSASTGVPMGPPPWGPGDYGPHGAIRGYFDEDVYAVFHWASHVLAVLDANAGQGYVWTDGTSDQPVFERAAPLRTLLHLWLARHGVQMAHAAAVGRPDGVALLVGGAGAGKSTLALACLAGSLAHLADDYCALVPGASGAPPRAHGIYATAKANADTIDRLGLGSLVENPVRPTWEKALLDLHRHAPDRLLTAAPVRAVIVPRVRAGAPTTSRRTTGAAALAALGPSTLLQLPGTGPHTMSRLAACLAGVPVYALEVGDAPDGGAAEVTRILDG